MSLTGTRERPADARRPLPPNARVVLEALDREARPLKAYDLLAQLKPRGISAPMTVYRALDRLMAEGYVCKIESLNAYVALPRPWSGEPVAFLLCRQCNRPEIVPLTDAMAHGLAALGKGACELYVEIRGDCQGCKAAALSPRAA